MTCDLVVLRTAHGLIRLHGEDAEYVVTQRADEFLSAGKLDDLSLTRRILSAIKELRRSAPAPGESTH